MKCTNKSTFHDQLTRYITFICILSVIIFLLKLLTLYYRYILMYILFNLNLRLFFYYLAFKKSIYLFICSNTRPFISDNTSFLNILQIFSIWFFIYCVYFCVSLLALTVISQFCVSMIISLIIYWLFKFLLDIKIKRVKRRFYLSKSFNIYFLR